MTFDSATQRAAQLQSMTGAARGVPVGVVPARIKGQAFASTLSQVQAIPVSGSVPANQSGGTGVIGPGRQAGSMNFTGTIPGTGYVPGGTPGTVGTPEAVGRGAAAWPSPGGGSTGQRIVALARGEMGVAESPPGSNDGPRIREYRTATQGAANTPGPWCAYFVSWMYQEAGTPIGPGGEGTGWVPAIETWGRQQGRYFEGRTPQPGDIAIFERTGDGVADHTGIVESVGRDGRIHTIEGNTSENRVSRRTYNLSEIKGFVRPG